MEGRERVGGWATADGWTWDDTSGWFGECGSGGGVETSDSPDEPAVDGRTSSGDSDWRVSLRAGLLRVGTISGQVHYAPGASLVSARLLTCRDVCSPFVGCRDTVCSLASPRRTGEQGVRQKWCSLAGTAAYLDFLCSACQTPRLAARELSPFAWGMFGLVRCGGRGVGVWVDVDAALQAVDVVGKVAGDGGGHR